MNIELFDFQLPEELIAQSPAEKRDECRLMVINREKKTIEHKRFHALALKTVLSQKAIKGLIVVDSLALKSISTKAFAKDLTAIKAEGKTLVIVPEKNDKLVKSAQNIASVTLRAVNDISVYDVLDATNIVISKDDVKTLEGGLQ